MRPVVELRDVSVKYGVKHGVRHGAVTALRKVSFSLGCGVNGILGVNGAGKTTLLRAVATALSPTSGVMSLLGYDPATAEGRLGVRRQLGYVPQDPGLFPAFTVYDFIDYVAILKEITSTSTRRSEVRRVLADVDLTAVAHRKIRALSGGMRARVSLAQALLGDPRLLILDEPTAGLDAIQRLHFRRLIGGLGRDRVVLLSTHLAEDVSALCSHVTVLHEGAIIFNDTPTVLIERARGRVWDSLHPVDAAQACWRTGDGRFRCIGDPPPGVPRLEPTLEDGYLLLTNAAKAPAAEP